MRRRTVAHEQTEALELTWRTTYFGKMAKGMATMEGDSMNKGSMMEDKWDIIFVCVSS